MQITLKFLEAVAQNNTTARMHLHHDLYVQEKKRYDTLVSHLLERLQAEDPTLTDITLKDCLYRFNRDIRFSKDKHPYKTRFGAFISPGGRKSPIPGYYLHIEPGNSGISGGSRCPSHAQRDAIVLEIWKNRKDWQRVVENPTFLSFFGEMGDKQEKEVGRILKTSRWKRLLQALGEKQAKKILQNPQALELLLYPRFCVWHGVSDEEVIQADFEELVMEGFRILRPFNEMIARSF